MGKIRTLLAITVCLAATRVHGQDVQVRVAMEKPPHYVGRPVVIQFTVNGFDQEPDPTVEIEKPLKALRGQLAGISPNVMSYMNSINGRVTRATVVTYTIQYRVTADHAGEFLVGPFVIKQGTKEAHVDAVPMTFEAVPEDPDMRIRLILPEGNVYPDQRVPVKIEWWYSGDADDVQDLSIYSPLFDQFRFAPDPEPRRGDSRLPIDTKDGRIILAAQGRRVEDQGKEFVAVTATRTLIPDRVGQFQLVPITATLERATSWVQERSLFDDFGFGSSMLNDVMGDRKRPAHIAIGRAVGEPKTLVIKPFPVAGRPESFAGAVGEGFSIDVAADRTVVRVGDPIGLDITLRGKGNLENASLPTLSSDGGLNPKLFRLPDGDVPGTMADSAKDFHVSVRVSDESVTELPALAYSWFDPKTETYQTARSEPIALRVMPAQVISAADVVSSTTASKHQTSPNDSTDASAKKEVAVATTKDPVFSLGGADLAIEPIAGAVLRDSNGTSRALLTQIVLYGLGFLLVLAAIVDRKRRDVDPALVAMRKNVRFQRTRIHRASQLPQKEAAREVADALRALVAELPNVARDGAQSVIAECESIVFAPAGADDSHLDKGLLDRAGAVADQFKESAQPAKVSE